MGARSSQDAPLKASFPGPTCRPGTARSSGDPRPADAWPVSGTSPSALSSWRQNQQRTRNRCSGGGSQEEASYFPAHPELFDGTLRSSPIQYDCNSAGATGNQLRLSVATADLGASLQDSPPEVFSLLARTHAQGSPAPLVSRSFG